MTAALIWIFLPFTAAIGLWALSRHPVQVTRLATLLCLLLAAAAWLIPIGKVLRLGPLTLEIQPILLFAGRRLSLTDADRPLLIFFFTIAAFWFAGARQAGSHRFFIPYGLAIVSFLVAAIAVEPFLYSALMIEMAVLLSIPILFPPGQRNVGPGLLRYLIFQTLAMPFILLAGWALDGVQANPTDINLIALASLFLSLGFAFWLAIFPFYTWVPLLAGETHPYAIGFLYLLLPITSLLLGLEFINAYGWLRNAPQLYLLLRWMGALMVITAGIWSAFQHNAGRLFGYALIIETGFSLLAVSLNSRLGIEIFTMLFLPRVIGFGLWALSSSILLQAGRSMEFQQLERAAEAWPFASTGLIVACLSLAGLPLLAHFPIRLVLLEQVARQSPLLAVWVLGGNIGFLLSTFRLLAVVTGGYFGPRQPGERPLQITLLSIGALSLVMIGLLPRLFLPMFTGLLSAFTRLP
jgi:NADH-quinone oxidoreductase subunit N